MTVTQRNPFHDRFGQPQHLPEPTARRRLLSYPFGQIAPAIARISSSPNLSSHQRRSRSVAVGVSLRPVLRVRDAKSERGERAVALAPMLAEMLWQRRRESAFQGDGELVFCHPEKGSPLVVNTYVKAFHAAAAAAGIEEHVRPFHDLRHAALTNGAAPASRRSR